MSKQYNIFIFIFLLLIINISVFSQSNPGLSRNRAIEIYNIGRDLESQGRMQEAETHYNEVIRICSDEISRNTANRDTYTALTWALLRKKNYNDVIIWGERGLQLFTDEHRILETIGEASFYLDDYESSLKFMQRYVNSQPRGERVSIAYFFIGEIYRLEGKNHLADIAYSTAVRLQPSIALWWFRLGQVREYSGDSIPAADAYEQALKLNPRYQAASEALSRLRLQ